MQFLTIGQHLSLQSNSLKSRLVKMYMFMAYYLNNNPSSLVSRAFECNSPPGILRFVIARPMQFFAILLGLLDALNEVSLITPGV